MKGYSGGELGETKGGKKKTAADVLDMDEGKTLEEYVEEIKGYVKGSKKKNVVVKGVPVKCAQNVPRED